MDWSKKMMLMLNLVRDKIFFSGRTLQSMVSGLEDVRMGGVRLGVLETIEELIKLCKLETMRS